MEKLLLEEINICINHCGGSLNVSLISKEYQPGIQWNAVRPLIIFSILTGMKTIPKNLKKSLRATYL